MDFKSIILYVFLIALVISFKSPYKFKQSKPKHKPIFSKLIYTDQKCDNKKNSIIYSKLLTSKKYNIKGKPDYIFKRFNKYIPIEIKSGQICKKSEPNLGDLLQLVSYFIIIEEVFNCKVKYGWLIYSDYMFVIKNRPYLRKKLFSTIKDMRSMLENGKGYFNCSFKNCNHCICKLTVCKEYNRKFNI